MIQNNEELQVPFRLVDLLPVNRFISLCQGYEIFTDEKELEYFEKMGLLFPAVRIKHGFEKCSEVLVRDKQTGNLEWQYVPFKLIKFIKKNLMYWSLKRMYIPTLRL